MELELISDADYDNLPANDEEKFVALEAVCRRNMNEMITRETSEYFDVSIRLQYMATVAAAAEELEIEGLYTPDFHQDYDHQTFTSFSMRVSAVVTKLRLRGTERRNAHSVRLASGTRGRIEQQVQRLRVIVTTADLPEGQRERLLQKLDELSVELSQSRVGFGRVMAILAMIAVGVTQSTSFLADAPEAIATITGLLGADKAAEEAEVRRLGPPPRPKSLPSPAPALGGIDDEIPL